MMWRWCSVLIHCYSQIQIAGISWLTGFFCRRCCCCGKNRTRVKALFPFLVKTQTTVLVQYMSTFIMRQIKCHSFLGAPFCPVPLGRNLVVFCSRDSTCFRLRWRKTSTWIFRPSCPGLPFIHSQFLLFSRASYFLLSISSSLTWFGLWGRWKCSRPDVSFIQAENGREGQEMCRELALFSHNSCPKELHHGDPCQEISDTSLPLHRNTLWHTRAGKSFSLHESGYTCLDCFIVKYS